MGLGLGLGLGLACAWAQEYIGLGLGLCDYTPSCCGVQDLVTYDGKIVAK